MGSHYVLAAVLSLPLYGAVASRLSRTGPVRPRQFRISRTPVGSVRTIRRPPAVRRHPPSRREARQPAAVHRAVQDQVRHAAACERLRNALRDVAARMRAGYNAKQGEQLRERKTKLEQQRRAQKCRVAGASGA